MSGRDRDGAAAAGRGALPLRLAVHPAPHPVSVPAHLTGVLPAEPGQRASRGRRADAGPGSEPAFRPERIAPELLPLWEALREVRDPELPVSIVDLGLVYDIRRSGTRIDVDLTFTATACPCTEFIRSDLRDRLLAEDSVDSVTIHEVWDPPWSRARITEEGRRILRRFGVAA